MEMRILVQKIKIRLLTTGYNWNKDHDVLTLVQFFSFKFVPKTSRASPGYTNVIKVSITILTKNTIKQKSEQSDSSAISSIIIPNSGGMNSVVFTTDVAWVVLNELDVSGTYPSASFTLIEPPSKEALSIAVKENIHIWRMLENMTTVRQGIDIPLLSIRCRLRCTKTLASPVWRIYWHMFTAFYTQHAAINRT